MVGLKLATTLTVESAKRFLEVRVHRLKEDCMQHSAPNTGSIDSGAALIRPESFVVWSSSQPAVLGCSAMSIQEPSEPLTSLMEPECEMYELRWFRACTTQRRSLD